MAHSPVAQKMFDEWDSLPRPSRRFQQKVQDQAEINAILRTPGHPVAEAYRKAESENDARYYADA